MAHHRVIGILATLALLTAALCIVPVRAQEELPAWGTVPSPNAGASPNRLNAVSVVSATDVWAAGSFGDYLHPEPMVQHWDGITWSIVSLPQGTGEGELFGIAVVAPNDVWFVGGYNSGGHSLILHWDGTSLSIVANPNPGTFNRLYAVAAVSANDVWAVGEFTNPISKTLVEHWDGVAWTVVPSPTRSGQYTALRSVAAISVNDVWAVGESGTDTFAVHWDGVRWRKVATPSQGFSSALRGVSGSASNDVWAVGDSSSDSLTIHWDGLAWSIVPSPNPGAFYNDLNAVVALSSSNVWAVGFYDVGGNWKTLAMRWNGRRWRVAASPSPDPTINVFYGVDAGAANDVWAVGEVGADVAGNVTLVEHWTGSSWNVVPSANAGTGDNHLNDISALATDDIWAVGIVNGDSLAMHWDGGSWSLVTTPNPPDGAPLQGVVAIAPDDVWAVGTTGSSSSLDSSTVTMHWDGAEWTIIPSPNPGGTSVDQLYGIDAVGPNDIWAVGEYRNANYVPLPMILRWDGVSWTVVPNDCGIYYVGLRDIHVIAADDIWAIGGTSCHYDGATWTEVDIPPVADSAITLLDVEASAPNQIFAVGQSVSCPDEYCVSDSYAIRWDGTEWKRTLPPGSSLGGVEALAADDVWAVGTAIGTLILHWDGNGWSTIPSPNPEAGGQLFGIDALAPNDLWAVGTYFTEDEYDLRNLALQAPSDTQGNVVGATGVSDAVVSWFGPVDGSTSTNSFGEYAAAGLPAGEYFFTASFGGCTPDSVTVMVIAGTTVTQDFQIDCLE